MFKHTMIFILVLLTRLQISAGDSFLYMPLDIQELYKDGTRSIDGNPGPEYWQNRAEYDIRVKLDPATARIEGQETISYFNESPDTLTQLVVRLYQDVYRRGNVRDWSVDLTDLHDGVNITSLSVNGETFNMDSTDGNAQRAGTHLIITPGQKILPGSQVDIDIAWNFIVPRQTTIRMGQYDSTSYFIGYWYPQVSVYDDVNGWDTYSYTGMQEFYNDFNSYRVRVTVPKNFIVWATGVLQNPGKVLASKYLQRYKKGQNSDEIVKIIEEKDLDVGNITQQKEWLTWTFNADHVTDFAFATSDHYLWDMTSLLVGEPGRRVAVDAAYNKESEDFYQVARIAREAIDYFSREMPAVPYPYPEMTVFNGSGGMEYPMMVNDGSTESIPTTISLTAHEIAHTYFPFYLGTNEKKYAWMDEGWAVMLPFGFVAAMTEELDRREVVTKQYNSIAGNELDIPLMVSSIVYGSHTYRPAYRGAAYTRSAMAYYALRQLLGEKLFLKALQTYMDRWNGKHPIPYDFFFTFDEVAGENLKWFWDPWFFEFGHPDLSIGGIVQSDNNLAAVIEKLGNIPVPVELNIIYKDGSERIVRESARIWADGKKDIQIELGREKKIERLELGTAYIPDTDLSNNTWVMMQTD